MPRRSAAEKVRLWDQYDATHRRLLCLANLLCNHVEPLDSADCEEVARIINEVVDRQTAIEVVLLGRDEDELDRSADLGAEIKRLRNLYPEGGDE
jgi:hypothetical protein